MLVTGQAHQVIGKPVAALGVAESALGFKVVTLHQATQLQGTLQLRLAPGTQLLRVPLQCSTEVAGLIAHAQTDVHHLANLGGQLGIAPQGGIVDLIDAPLKALHLLPEGLEHHFQARLAGGGKGLALLLEDPASQVLELPAQGLAGVGQQLQLLPQVAFALAGAGFQRRMGAVQRLVALLQLLKALPTPGEPFPQFTDALLEIVHALLLPLQLADQALFGQRQLLMLPAQGGELPAHD